MNFNQLDSQTKQQLHEQLKTAVESLGGINFFLQLIEDSKKEKTHPLLNKSSVYHFSKGKLSWNKAIYKDTLDLLIETIKKEEKDANFFENLKPKHQKNTINMMKALKPITIEIKPKKAEDGEGFILNIIDSSDAENIKVSMLYKMVFFYNIALAKEVFSYKPEVN